VIVGAGRAVTVFVIPDDVATQLFSFVTMTLTTCPFVRLLVVYVDRGPF
jgi:hypothetical protein